MHRRSDTLFGDAGIAATARRHAIAVVTRTGADFAAFEVGLLDPFAARRR